MKSRERYTFTLNPSVAEQARKVAGLVPLSRWLERLITDALREGKFGGEQVPEPHMEVVKMRSAVELISAAVLEAEEELTELDKKRVAVALRFKELKHDVVLLSGSPVAPATPAKVAPAPPAESKLLDKGEKVGEVRVNGNVTYIYKNVRRAVLGAMTTSVPSGEWFVPSLIKPAVARFYGDRLTHTVQAYLMFLVQLKFVEYNGGSGRGAKYRWFPRFKETTMTEEEVKRRIEEDRKALQDVMG